MASHTAHRGMGGRLAALVLLTALSGCFGATPSGEPAVTQLGLTFLLEGQTPVPGAKAILAGLDEGTAYAETHSPDLFADDAGRLNLTLASGRYLLFVEAPGLTRERVPIDASGPSQQVDVLLYRGTVPFRWKGTFEADPAVGTPAGPDETWMTQPLQLHPDPRIQEAYLARLGEITGTFTWRNRETESSVLLPGLSLNGSRPFFTWTQAGDRPSLAGYGTYRIPVWASRETWQAELQAPGNSGRLELAVMTRQPVVSASGILFDFDVELGFFVEP